MQTLKLKLRYNPALLHVNSAVIHKYFWHGVVIVLVPAPPTITEAQIGDREITFRYVPPTDTGGTELDRYYYSIDGGDTWVEIEEPSEQPAEDEPVEDQSIQLASMTTVRSSSAISIVSDSARTLRITGLNNGEDYSVAIRAAHIEAIGYPTSNRML